MAEEFFARQVGRFISDSDAAALPESVVEYGKMVLASTLASAALGSTLDSSKIVRRQEISRGGNTSASAWFGEWERLPSVACARLNALMSDAAASDDSDLRNIVHSGTPATAAALAVGQEVNASGSEIVHAIVLGYEVAGTINTGVIGGLQRKGFHGCVVATFAAAAAAARLYKLNEEQAANALSLTATSMGGLHAVAAVSLAREFHAGNAAMVGVQCAQAAALGYASAPDAFDMKRGFFATLGNGNDISSLAAELGKKWNILTELGVKLVPGGSPFHAVAEAAALAAEDGNLDVDDIRQIYFTLPDYPFPGPKRPADLIGIAHSPFYFAAAGAADREYGWQHAFAEKIQSPRIRSLFDRIERDDREVVNKNEFKSGAIVRIEARDGRVFERSVRYPKGAAVRGIDWNDLAGKYAALMPHGGLNALQIDDSLALVRELDKLPSIDSLFLSLRK
ncbi:MmgE/PrpD family protein [Bordetella sp. N]|uniref:MmgE/PrpD family protein n=1 Tax=Bordetella sp. N TaxID=1746199 RepID=UPI0009EA9F26|nr:MmgE/PrpD family protein [Bordetella sp. N]